MKILTVKVADGVFAEIASAAKARNVPKSEIVRERLTHNSAAAAKRAKGSLWSRMDDLVIHSDSLPVDLSANKAHLKTMAKTVVIDSGAISITPGRERTSRRRRSLSPLVRR